VIFPEQRQELHQEHKPGAFHNVVDTTKNVISTVYNDAVGIVKTPFNSLDKAIDTTGSVVKDLGKDVTSLGTNLGSSVSTLGSNLGSSLSTPLAIAAGIVAVIVLTKK